uniref:Uncharacterized protein n=1 Tax=Anopheles culicifacies TaxID=139723 RepID=A0A182MJK3_9DIPT
MILTGCWTEALLAYEHMELSPERESLKSQLQDKSSFSIQTPSTRLIRYHGLHTHSPWLRHENEMKLRLVPFGKAWVEELPNEPPKFHCQHGPQECQLNILHGCILKKLPPKKAFAVEACLMKNFRTNFDQVGRSHQYNN